MRFAFVEDQKVVQLVVTSDPEQGRGGKECSDDVQLGWVETTEGVLAHL